jgi:hypothetical protein
MIQASLYPSVFPTHKELLQVGEAIDVADQGFASSINGHPYMKDVNA